MAEQPIQLETPTGVINGTLTAPAESSKVPLILLIAGSGPTDRNGNTPLTSGRNDSLKLLAEGVAEAGFASVRYDKRGVAGSLGAVRSETNLRIESYVQDAASWVTLLASDSRFSSVSIVGHSEGSLIGMLAAQRCPSQAFVSIAGPAERGADILRRQLRGRLPLDLVEQNEAILSTLEDGQPSAEVPPQLMALYRPSVQTYLISWFKYSPTEEFMKLNTPCLIVQGDADTQVGVPDAEALHAARSQSKLKIVHGMNHVLKLIPANSVQQRASYDDSSLSIAADLVRTLTRFLVLALNVSVV
jgi:pimeloyl-ACP methyl ester carboxylesterase